MQKSKFQFIFRICAIIFLLSTFNFQLSTVINAQEQRAKVKKSDELKAGQLAPLFALRNLEGSYFSLKNYCDVEDTKVPAVLRKEKSVVIINFFSTICIPCIKELPALLKIYEKYKDKGLKMFLVSVDPRPEEVLPQFIKENTVTIPILLDMYSKTLEKYGFDSVPHTLLIDKNRKILAIYQECEDIEKKLDEKLNQIFK